MSYVLCLMSYVLCLMSYVDYLKRLTLFITTTYRSKFVIKQENVDVFLSNETKC